MAVEQMESLTPCFVRSKAQIIVCQCQEEVRIQITRGKSQGQCEPDVCPVPSSAGSGSCQGQRPRSRLWATGHRRFWMDVHL